MNGTSYDLIIYEASFGSSLLGFADLIGNPPIVSISTFYSWSVIDVTLGNPIIPSYITTLFLPKNYPMSIWDRMENLYTELYFNYIYEIQVLPLLQKHMHENFGNVHRNIRELKYNKSLLIVSADLAASYPKPIQPNTVYVGPLHIQETQKPLPSVSIFLLSLFYLLISK